MNCKIIISCALVALPLTNLVTATTRSKHIALRKAPCKPRCKTQCKSTHAFTCNVNTAQTLLPFDPSDPTNPNSIVTFDSPSTSSHDVTPPTAGGTEFTIQKAGVYRIQWRTWGFNTINSSFPLAFQVFKTDATNIPTALSCSSELSDGLGSNNVEHELSGFVIATLNVGDTIDLRSLGTITLPVLTSPFPAGPNASMFITRMG